MIKRLTIERRMSIRVLGLLLVLFTLPHTKAQTIKPLYKKQRDALLLSDKNTTAAILVDSSDAEVVQVVAKAFAGDIQKITGQQPLQVYQLSSQPVAVIAGTLGKSSFINQIAATHADMAAIKGKWETFYITMVSNPLPGVKQVLVIAGSDPRGTAFGLFEVSRKMGVHPFNWWADVTPEHHDALYLKIDKPIIQSPSVQYRGIFLNDEDWGLQPWAAAKMDTDIKDIGPKTYEKIFELLLRLKANYIWPAMHPCTKAFWYYKGNPEMARRYDIVLGASHCEPMLRNNVFEWADNFQNEYGKAPGTWRYDSNQTQIYNYWNDRVKEAANNDALYTVGMRGIHDGRMPGPPSMQGKKELLQKVIDDQRTILANNANKGAAAVPQLFCPYKEVLDVYQSGLQLPDDITIAWADDNYGYIRQLPDDKEQKRSGRGGVYYHLSYWGSPADYLWLSTISPSLIAYEMGKAYHYTADKVWIFNVGDIKPAEMEIQFALDFAWDVKAWPPEKAYSYAEKWAEEIFGQEFAVPIYLIKLEYYALAAAGKPEHLNKLSFTDREVEKRLHDYNVIADEVEYLKGEMPQRLQDAFFQLIYYPVMGAKLMNEKFLYARKSVALAKAGDSTALLYAQKAKDAFTKIQELTTEYNTKIAGGKWNGIMDWQPRKQAVFTMPEVATSIAAEKTELPEEKWVQKVPVLSYNKAIVPSGKGAFTRVNLGYTDDGITVLPWQTDTAKSTMPYLEYKPYLSDSNIHSVIVKCLPTFRIYDGLQLRYGIQVGNTPIQWVDISTKAETKDWAQNVLQGFVSGTTQHWFPKDALIRIYLPDAGVVINSIEIL